MKGIRKEVREIRKQVKARQFGLEPRLAVFLVKGKIVWCQASGPAYLAYTQNPRACLVGVYNNMATLRLLQEDVDCALEHA